MRLFKMKIVFVCILVMSMLMGALTAYADSPSAWATAEVTEARGFGLVIPEADQNYQTNITRELFCELVVNMVEQATGSPVTITIANPFTDTTNSDIVKAYQLGIVNGTSATTFAPSDLITREQVAAMMMRAARKLDDLMSHNYTVIPVPSQVFADQGDISNWALSDVRYANALGIMNGVGGNRIAPQNKTTIEQSILLTLRVFKEYESLMGVEENHPPEAIAAANFTIDVEAGNQVTIYIPDYIYDRDGDTLTVTAAQENGYGTWVPGGGSQEFTYTAGVGSAQRMGLAQLNISDGTDEETFTFTFNITQAVQGLTPIQTMAFQVNEGETLTINASQLASGGTPYITSAIHNGVAFGSTSFSDSSDQPSGFNYAAQQVDEDKQETLIVGISNGDESITVDVIIQVLDGNNPPEPISSNIVLYMDEDTTMEINANDIATDPDGDTLRITNVVNHPDDWGHPVGDFSSYSISGRGTTYIFDAAEIDQTAQRRLLITVSDGTDETEISVKIQVNNIN